jgi:peptidoglycan/LPS O-acetylase OafA/YrhL
MSIKMDPPTLLSARTDRTTTRVTRKFRPDIEGLRAVAVTLVVLSHLGLGFPGGYVGVDVFFVISGFIITRQLGAELNRNDRISFREFYARRARRILPAATVVIVGTMLACWKWKSPLQVKSDASDGLFSALSAINWRLAVNGTNYFQASTPPSPFQHFWSLSVEEQFYAVWPVLILVISVAAGNRFGRRKSLVQALLLVMAVSLILTIRTTASSPSWAYFGTQTRAWELAFGALLAVTVNYWTRMPPALASQMSWLGLGMITLSGFTCNGSTEYPGSAVVLPVMGAAFVIAGGSPGWSRSAELVLGRRPVQFLGRTSYSLYLVHWPVLVIAPLAIGHALTTADKWLVLFGSLALAVLMFYTVEQPARRWSWPVRKPWYGLAFGSIMVAASISATMLVSDHVVIPGGTGAGHAVTATSSLKAVAQAIAAGTKLTKLPQDITPSLERAADDRSFTTSACLMGELATTPAPNRRCSFGDLRSGRAMAVVGDSHANQWTPALDAFAKANHWKIVLYTMAACPAGVYPYDIDLHTNRVYTQCNEWRNGVFARLKALRPRVVLVASELRTIDIDPSGMVQAIHNFQGTGARVIYLEDTPNPERVGPVPDCLAGHPDNVQTCSLSRQDPATRLNGFIQRRIESAAVRRTGAALIDPTSWFCTTTMCPPVINNIVVYMDDSHVTASYVRWLTPVMSAALKKAMTTR